MKAKLTKEPTIKVNLWVLHTLVRTITMPHFVSIPGIVIIDGEHYVYTTNREYDKSSLNYIKASVYESKTD